MPKCPECGRTIMPETIRQKMIRQGRLRPDGRNWFGQCVFFGMPLKSGLEMPAGMTSEEVRQFLQERDNAIN